MLDIASITLQQVFQALLVPISGFSGAGILALILKYSGKKLFNAEVSTIITEDYGKIGKQIIEDDLREGILKELKTEMLQEVEDLINSHCLQCKHSSMIDNDDRYLLRHEFKIFLENQNKTNERMEQAVAEVRKVCDQILLKISS
jgi:hypothetical protein